MRRFRVLRTFLALACFGAVGLSISPSSAFDAQVSAETTAQGYQLRNAWGDPVLSRRRFMQTLGLNVTNIGEGDSDVGVPSDDEPHVSFRMRLRFDSDFAVQASEVDYKDSPSVYVAGLERSPLDLMYGYVDVQNLASGMLHMRLGRQYVIDPLGWWSFDGAHMRVELPIFMAFEGYGGFEQRAGLPLSLGRFEPDGVWRGDRDSLDANAYPGFLEAGVAPALGVVAETYALPVVHGRVAYRKVWNSGRVATNPFSNIRTGLPDTTEGYRTSQERVGASADALVQGLGSVRVGLVYDLPRARFSSWYGSIDAFLMQDATVGVDVDRNVPTFDGDSIWSWFSSGATSTALGRVDVGLTQNLRVAAAGGVRWVELDISAESTGTPSLDLDVLGRASAHYQGREGKVGVSGMVDRGERGEREGVDILGDYWFERRFLVLGRVSLFDWHDEYRPERSATSLGYVLGGGYRIGDVTQARVEWEHDTNELVGQRYRILASLQLLVTP
ncbi:MAG: hypothetical protein CSA75_04835 [Sorangium cellulosum]|nr:MAG: hypothetical protein CSA75_04835 [Sorangium cellulosum]